ncbi:uncharacterized protein Z520_00618 [Fonsecaea multimorphosa CBS 102226]|uniref:Transmembrane protein n=1 Tax=Fonsecaea multimorphosa CBS 102226 TaxID=1442371 RepID=A0A0D2HPY9_9EURO|nr:uncharacterized protein Z520_00618 [Fonsecaea multimorphosa CBS 102226]KIY03926.1 hypothetical protein Z520_00618 [Fonsecaea multimorphosa CBS 102226]OAL31767.1 hypothetical protein AYO22_00637 [Fonsecaea multimorphosa]
MSQPSSPPHSHPRSQPHPQSSSSSIPGYRPGPYLTRSKKFFLAAIVFIPVVSYMWLRRLERQSRERTRLLEEEGRRNWIQAEKEKQRWLASRKERDLSVTVGRSGGGV